MSPHFTITTKMPNALYINAPCHSTPQFGVLSLYSDAQSLLSSDTSIPLFVSLYIPLLMSLNK